MAAAVGIINRLDAMKKILFAMLALTAVAACQREELGEQEYNPAPVGDEVQFAAVHGIFTSNGPETKTIYGDRNENFYPIYWINGDQIGIYCPQSSYPAPYPQYDYKVVVDNATSTTGTLAKINPDANGLQWGDTDIHDFYGIYPANASEGGMSATEVKCSIPLRQDPVDIVYDAGTKTYTAMPNMNYAYMYAHTQVSRKTQGDKPIPLSFKPIVTVLEITINGPTSTPTTGDYKISQVSVRSDANITGDFILTISDDPEDPDDGLCTPVQNGTVSNLLTIPTYKDGVPVTLKPGEKLVVKAFMLPYAAPAVNTTTVTVNMVGQGSKTKILSTDDIVPHAVNITSLPALPSINDVETYYWLSAMDKRTYFSQLSIPGSHNSYNVDASLTQGTNSVMSAYQKLSIEEQFKAGARAFSLMVGFDRYEAGKAVAVTGFPNRSSTGWNDDYDLYIYAGGTQTSTTLETALDSYVSMLSNAIKSYPVEGRDCQEFIVLNIDYKQITGSGNNNQDKYTEVKRWIKEIDRILSSYQPADDGIKFISHISSSTTIADLMGGIVIFVNYQSPYLPEGDGAANGYLWGETYDGYTYLPDKSDNYVFMRKVWRQDMSEEYTNTFWGLNDRDYDFAFYSEPEGSGAGVQVWKQSLQRLNNPYLGDGGNYAPYAGRIDTKVNIAKTFFNEAINNNLQPGDAGLNRWYINNLGGFCVVNNSASYNKENGESGNTVLAAHYVNSDIYDFLIDPANNSGPVGVVLLNFFGVDNMNDQNSGNLDLYGALLPQVIMENNFRFALKRSE